MFSKAAGRAMAVMGVGGALFLTGCLVSKDEYTTVRLERDEALASLHEFRTTNEVLAAELMELYKERELLLARLNMEEKAFSAARDEAAQRQGTPAREERSRPTRSRTREGRAEGGARN